MNSLPPLRTVSGVTTPVPVSSTTLPTVLAANHTIQIPKATTTLLTELVELGVLTPQARTEFLRVVGNRIGQLATRELTGDALVGLKFLTQFQLSRVLSGQGATLRIGHYLVRERLESGSASVVFLGDHPLLKRRVAIKVVTVEDGTPVELVDRFFGEARMLAALNHPNVVTLHDAGEVVAANGVSGLIYLVLEYVPGGELEKFVYARGPQPAGVVCEWGRQVASALHAAHAAGLVHRDLKPSNLLLTETQRLKLIDFGLAREFASTKTEPGVLLGSLEFLAPEQLADAPTVGPAADVYGLGAVLFWALTGHLPIPTAATRRETIQVIRTRPPRRAAEVRPDVPHEVDELLARMLARNPAERPSTGEVEAAFAKFASPSPMTVLAGSAPVADDANERERLRTAVQLIEEVAKARATEAAQARVAILAALTAAAAARPTESGGHQQRVAAFTRFIADALSKRDEWPMCADPVFVGDLTRAASAHDLGLVAIPDEILTHVGKLMASDQVLYETHPVVGDRILDELANEFGPALPFLRVARAVVRHHHEHWDGTGYPDKLKGDHIPPVARIVAVADAYDTLRRGAFGARGVPHAGAVNLIAKESGKLYDPAVVEALQKCAPEFERVYRMMADEPLSLELPPEPRNQPA
jgi:HD-GYP domain-containing protein (c-di-GMP phosphodiesterase class II)/tRNA A-37 threonylcarbamoyl transferase component Bud32